MDDGSWLPWLFVVLLLFCAAYFAAAETSFSSLSRMRLKSKADKGDRSAVKALYILDNFDKAITTILIGTNIVHISTASIVTLTVTKTWGISAVTVSTIITTMVIFFAGEMLPKSIGKKYSERFSLALAGSLYLIMKLLSPVAWLLSTMGSALARLSGGDAEVTVTEDELYDIIENMKDEGELDAEKGELVHSALMFDDVTVESIITSRVDVAAIDIDASPEEVLAFVRDQKHSRLPVYRGNIDNIIGVLQIRKYIKAYMKYGLKLNLKKLLDEPYFTHQSTKIDDLLREMSRRRLNVAVVTDNYGGTLGIVTVEDILEELVGEIWDEDDEVVESFTLLPDGRYEITADTEIADAFHLMGFDDPEEHDWEHKLLGEWAYEQFGSLPRQGDSFEYNGLVFTISLMRKNRIIKLKASMPREKEEGGESK